MLFDAIFLSLFLSGWLICGFIPWLALSVATRGEAGLAYLPLSMFAGAVAGLAVPVLGADGWSGIWLSFLSALTVPGVLLAARRFSLRAPGHTPIPTPEHHSK